MMKIAYIAAFHDVSGYSDAARNNVAALSSVGVPIEAYPLSFEEFKTDCGELGRIVKNMICSNCSAPIQIIHTIPPVFEKFLSLNKYNIGYTTWETNRLPKDWIDCINQLNEVWVPSNYNKEVFLESGITIPIFVMPHTFNRSIFEKEMVSNVITKPNSFVFYSIFQFLERKGPFQLLKAYLTEFQESEDVCLLLKTYLFNPTNQDERDKLKKIVFDVKEKLRLSSYPNIYLIASALSRPQINRLHKDCDCLVSSHSSEGSGITLTESMMAGNPVIATNYSGSTDFLTEDTGYPVDYQLTPVYNMPWPAYDGSQTWADINIMDLRKKMRYVFENQKEARTRGLRGQRFVDNNLSWEAVGRKMKNRLEVIFSGLNK